MLIPRYGKIHLLMVLALLLSGLCSMAAGPASRPVAAGQIACERDDRILSKSDYIYWDRGGHVEMDITRADGTRRIFESLLRLEGNEGERYNLILNVTPGYAPELLWVIGSEVERHILPGRFPVGSTRLTFSFGADSAALALPDTVIRLSGHGIRGDGAYRVHVGTPSADFGLDIGNASGFRTLSENDSRTGSLAWFWVTLVLVVDALVFLVVYLRRRRHRRQPVGTYPGVSATSAEAVSFPQADAIYLLGEFRVLDHEGEEISARMSPLTRELFLLLVLTSPHGGIDSKKLTEILWPGKDEASAKNNRAVNLHKLRTALAGVPGAAIEKSGGKWLIRLENVYVDYYSCIDERLRPDSLTPDRIRILAAMTAKGGLLPHCDYLWLDRYKSRLADHITNALLKYAADNDDSDHYAANLQISDIVFSFDATNEAALSLKCRTYQDMRRQHMAKREYDHFCRIYRELYGEDYPHSLSFVLSR